RYRLAEGIDLLPRERQRRARTLESDFVRARVDGEEQISLRDHLIVMNGQIDDVAAHLRGDPDEVSAHRCVVCFWAVLPLPERDDSRRQRAQEDERADDTADHATPAATRYFFGIGHRLSHGTRPSRV